MSGVLSSSKLRRSELIHQWIKWLAEPEHVCSNAAATRRGEYSRFYTAHWGVYYLGRRRFTLPSFAETLKAELRDMRDASIHRMLSRSDFLSLCNGLAPNSGRSIPRPKIFNSVMCMLVILHMVSRSFVQFNRAGPSDAFSSKG